MTIYCVTRNGNGKVLDAKPLANGSYEVLGIYFRAINQGPYEEGIDLEYALQDKIILKIDLSRPEALDKIRVLRMKGEKIPPVVGTFSDTRLELELSEGETAFRFEDPDSGRIISFESHNKDWDWSVRRERGR